MESYDGHACPVHLERSSLLDLARASSMNSVLFGRDEICERIGNALKRAEQGKGGAICVVGSPGIGKTALLNHVMQHNVGWRVLAGRGAQDESNLSYASLGEIVAPLLHLLPRLDRTQASALASALAIGPTDEHGEFAVYMGVLSLITAASEERPLAILVDDVQWLDDASLNALKFVIKRLQHDRVMVILAFRADARLGIPVGVPVIELDGLDREASAMLLSREGLQVDTTHLTWLMGATGGNPLALKDLPKYMQLADLTAASLRAEPAPIGPVLEDVYAEAVATLQPNAQQAALIAAILDDTEPSVLRRALEFLDFSMSDLEPVEDAGLIEVSVNAVRLRHPLIRSAIMQRATPSKRRSAHRAAADGLLSSMQPRARASRVWHLAESVVGTDEPVAQLLEQLATSSKARAGYAAAAVTYERAADLSELAETRYRRLLSAAEAALAAGRSGKSSEAPGQGSRPRGATP